MTDLSLLSSDAQRRNLYRSIPLPRSGKFIRVLEIEDSQASEPSDDPLRCCMRVVNLEQYPSFTALSYVWRQRTTAANNGCNTTDVATNEGLDTNYILCNHVPISITRNCWSALFHLRKRLGKFTIWIDAVCINQEDKEEKSLQIPLMGDIYMGAREVYIWLGEGNKATDRAITYLDQAGFHEDYLKSVNIRRKMPFNRQIWVSAWSAFSAFSSTTRHPFPFISKDLTSTWRYPFLRRHIASGSAIYATYYDLNELLDCEWTKRIWTYQEIILARNPVIVCGYTHLSWSRFTLSILFLDHIKPRLMANLGVPIDKTIQTWKKLLLARVRLMDVSIPDGEDKCERQGTISVRQSNQTDIEKGGEFELSHSSDLPEYRQFIFEMFYTCLIIYNTVVALAWLSLFNLIAALITTSYSFSKHSPTFRRRTDFIIYISISIFVFFLIYPYYAVMVYSHFYKTFFSRPFHSQYRLSLREDAVDDFIDAVVTRRASEPRDMAYGLQTVLERRLGRPLPTPNYDIPLSQAYRRLTINLLDATDQLQFLVLAAANKMCGQPSWVPNWGAGIQSFWLHPFAIDQAWASSSNIVGLFERMERYGAFMQSSARHHPSSRQRTPLDQETPRQTDSPKMISHFDSLREDTLTISAHSFGTIEQVFEIHPTKTYYDPHEKHIHLVNISSLLSVLHSFSLSLQVDVDFFTNRQNFPSLPSTITSHHLRLYFIFIWNSQWRTPDRILELLMKEDTTLFFPIPNWPYLPLWLSITYEELLETHIAICNDLATTRRQFFKAKAEGRGRGRNEEVAGVCGQDAVVGDKLLLVPGLMSSLVTRKADVGDGDSGVESKEDKGEIRLVSPAVVFIFVEREIKERGPERLEPFVLL